MSSDYTPTLAQVRDFWASDGNLQPAAKSYEYGEGCTEFDRFIRKVEAGALREAGAAVMGERLETETEAGNWLDERADRIESGDGQ